MRGSLLGHYFAAAARFRFRQDNVQPGESRRLVGGGRTNDAGNRPVRLAATTDGETDRHISPSAILENCQLRKEVKG